MRGLSFLLIESINF